MRTLPVQEEGVYGGTWFPRQIARGPRCGAALHFRRNAAIVPLARSLLDRSSGPFSFRRRSRLGPSGPRRECGVRRREPLCGATGVYQIKGAPAALCAVGSKKEMVGTEAPLLEGVRSAAYGRKEKLGPLRGKKVVRLRRGKKTAPQAEACGAAVIHFFKKNCGKIFYWGWMPIGLRKRKTKSTPQRSTVLRASRTESRLWDTLCVRMETGTN